MLSWRRGALAVGAVVLQGCSGAEGAHGATPPPMPIAPGAPTDRPVPPAPPPEAQACGMGGLVDAGFRDAALAMLQQLAVHAPGQAAHGAVRASGSSSHVDPAGAPWHVVSAYQVNLALAGALRIAPQLAGMAADWLRWQARHSTPTGEGQAVVFDHWVRASDLRESPCPPGLPLDACPQVDAYDSTAASLLLMADRYHGSAHDAALLHEPAVRAALHAAAATMVALTQPQGLTSAKPGYPVAYLMDAVEVAAGWRAWARVQEAVYGERAAAQASRGAAQRVEAAIREHLWHAPSRSWRVSLGAGAPVFSRWYPDSVAQAWPLLWGIGTDEAAAAAASQDAWRRAAAHWRGASHWAERNVDVDGFWWPAAAVAARCVGDDTAARTWVARARSAWLDTATPFAWPFHVGDLRWLFWMADPLAESVPLPERKPIP